MNHSKIAGIETFRVIAIFAVICIHTYPFLRMSEYRYAGYLINNLIRFAVPFFFLTSGYFFGKTLQKGVPVWGLFYSRAKHLFILFFSWSLLYAVLPVSFPPTGGRPQHQLIPWLLQRPHDKLAWIQSHKLKFLMEGTSIPLWFLVSLMIALLVLTCFIYFKKEKHLLIFSAILFLVGLLGRAYIHTPLGVHLPYSFDTRGGPFFSTLFVVIGWQLSFLKNCPSARFAFFLAVAGFFLHMGEVLILHIFFKGSFTGNDYVLGTIPFGTGVFLFSLAKHELGKLSVFPKLAALTLGIYVAHSYCLNFIFPIANKYFSVYVNSFSWQILFPTIVFLCTATIVFFLKRWRLTRFLVA